MKRCATTHAQRHHKLIKLRTPQDSAHRYERKFSRSCGARGTRECGHLIWPRLVRFSSSVLAPPSGVVAADGGVSSPVLAPPLSE